MNIEKIRKRFGGEFKPFTVLTSDGRKFHVPSLGTMALGKHEVVVMDKDGETEFLDPAHIVSLKTIRAEKVNSARKRPLV